MTILFYIADCMIDDYLEQRLDDQEEFSFEPSSKEIISYANDELEVCINKNQAFAIKDAVSELSQYFCASEQKFGRLAYEEFKTKLDIEV